jgi:hypothetical protein
MRQAEQGQPRPMTTHELTIAAVVSAPNDESPTTQRLRKKAPPVGPDSIPIDRDQLAALRALRRVFGADQIQVLSVEPRTCYGASFENDDGYGCGVCVERATIPAGYPHRLERVVTAETHTIGATTASVMRASNRRGRSETAASASQSTTGDASEW